MKNEKTFKSMLKLGGSEICTDLLSQRSREFIQNGIGLASHIPDLCLELNKANHFKFSHIVEPHHFTCRYYLPNFPNPCMGGYWLWSRLLQLTPHEPQPHRWETNQFVKSLNTTDFVPTGKWMLGLYTKNLLFTDLSPLMNFPIANLHFSRHNLSVLPSFAGISPIMLNIVSYHYGDWHSLNGMNLHYLGLGCYRDTDNLSFIKEMDNIDYLNLGGSPITNLQQLRGAKIKSLNLAGCKQLTSLDGIQGIQGLEYLRLSGDSIADFSILRSLPLKVFNGYGLKSLKDLSVFRSMHSLETLIVNETDIYDLSPISNLRLKELGIRYTKVKDLSPLRTVPSLQHIACNMTAISDVSPLAGSQLESGIFTGCDFLKDISPLRGITTLKMLHLPSALAKTVTGFNNANIYSDSWD